MRTGWQPLISRVRFLERRSHGWLRSRRRLAGCEDTWLVDSAVGVAKTVGLVEGGTRLVKSRIASTRGTLRWRLARFRPSRVIFVGLSPSSSADRNSVLLGDLESLVPDIAGIRGDADAIGRQIAAKMT